MKPHKYAEVIHAFAEGKAVQWRDTDNDEWNDTEFPSFDSVLEWRIKPSKFPAPPEDSQWHNPNKLTPEQVEIEDGWRLLLDLEITNKDRKKDVHFWMGAEWTPEGGYTPAPTQTFRTKRPLPVPKKLPEKQPYSQESWNFEWVRNLLFTKDHAHVLGVTEMGITVLDKGIVKVATWDTLMTMEGSNDRVNWVPLYR